MGGARSGLGPATFPFLEHLDDEGRRVFAAFPSRRLEKKTPLVARGARGVGAVLVLAGRLRVYYVSAQGREATLYEVEPGGTCVLALTAAFNDEPYPAWVEAGPRGATFVRIPNETFRGLLDQYPGFRRFVFGALSGRLLELMRALEEVGSARLEQRVARWLLRHAHTAGAHAQRPPCIRVSQQALAAELGTAREVVFRTLRGLSERRLIKTGRMRIEVVDPVGLSHLAQQE